LNGDVLNGDVVIGDPAGACPAGEPLDPGLLARSMKLGTLRT